MLTVDRDHWPTLLDRALHSSAYAIIHQYRRSGDHRGEAAKKEPGPHGDPARTVRTTGYPTNGGASTTDGEAFLAARRDPPGGCRIGPPVVHAGIAHRRPSARPQSIVSHRQEVAGKRQLLGTQVAITPYMSSMCVRMNKSSTLTIHRLISVAAPSAIAIMAAVSTRYNIYIYIYIFDRDNQAARLADVGN